MQKQEFDMEVTEHRAVTMLETLAMLYADQMGMKIKSMKIFRTDAEGNKMEELPRKAVI